MIDRKRYRGDSFQLRIYGFLSGLMKLRLPV